MIIVTGILGARGRDVGIKSRPACSAGPYELLVALARSRPAVPAVRALIRIDILPSTLESRVACDWDYFEAASRRKNRKKSGNKISKENC